MTLADTEELALSKMDLYGLIKDGWQFEFNNSKSILGQCKYGSKTITISKEYAQLNDFPALLDTVLHEIAHALVGTTHGHGPVWKKKALELGCSASRSANPNTEKLPPKKYIGECPAGHIHFRQRKPNQLRSCGACYPGFNLSALIKFRLNDSNETYNSPRT